MNNGDNVSILSTDPKDETVFGKVGEDKSNVSNRYINPKDINEIQITKNNFFREADYSCLFSFEQ